MESLEKLTYLTDRLVDFEAMANRSSSNVIEYDVAGGHCVGTGLYYHKDCAIQMCYVSGGTRFPEHSHDEVEIFVVIDGSGEVLIQGIPRTFQAQSVITVPIGTRHSWNFQTTTKLLCITIPASTAYPRSGERAAEPSH